MDQEPSKDAPAKSPLFVRGNPRACSNPLCRSDFVPKRKDQRFCCPKCKDKGAAVKLETPKGILLSSVHRAKGLEADRVFIIEPGLMPHPGAKSDWQRVQEDNLKYVAITRAIRSLFWVFKDY